MLKANDKFNRLEDLKRFNPDLEILGTIKYSIKEIRKQFRDLSPGKKEVKFNSNVPKLICSKKNMDYYRKGNFAEIKKLEKSAHKEVDLLYTRIKDLQDDAWVPVKNSKTGELFHASWTNTTFMWSQVIEQVYNESDKKFFVGVQIGVYCDTSKTLGIYNYNLSTDFEMGALAVTMFFAGLVMYIIRNPVTLALGSMVTFLTEFFSSRFIISVSVGWLGTLVSLGISSMLSIVLYFGISFLWQLIHHRFVVDVMLFNFSNDYDMKIEKSQFDNVLVTEDGFNGNLSGITIPKITEKGENINIPIAPGIEVLEDVVNYLVVILENDNRLFEGFDFGSSQQILNKNKNVVGWFTFGLEVPFFSKNKLGVVDKNIEPSQFWKSGNNWNPNPLDINLTIQTNEEPHKEIYSHISFDKITQAENDIYKMYIAFDKDKP